MRFSSLQGKVVLGPLNINKAAEHLETSTIQGFSLSGLHHALIFGGKVTGVQ